MGVFSLPAGVVRWLVSLGALKERVDLGVAEQDQLVPLSQRAKQRLIDGTLVAEVIAAALERAGETPSVTLRQTGSNRRPVDRWRAVAEALSEHVDVVLDEDICQDLAAASDETLAAELLVEVYTVLRAYHQQKKKKRPNRKPERKEGYAATSQRRDRSPAADSRERSRRESPSGREKAGAAGQKTPNLIEKPKSVASSPRSRKTSPRVEAVPSPVVESAPVKRPIVSPKPSEGEVKKIDSSWTVPTSAKAVREDRVEENGTTEVVDPGNTFLTIDEPSAIESPILPTGTVGEVDAESSLLALTDRLDTATLDPPWAVLLSTALDTLQVARPGTLDECQVQRMVIEGEMYPFTSSSLVEWYTSVLPHHIEDLPLSIVCKVALPALDSTVYGVESSKAAAGLLYLAASRGKREDNSISALLREGYIHGIVEAIRNTDDAEEARSSLCSALFQIWHRDGASLVTLFTGHLGRRHSEIMPVAHGLVATLSQHGEPFMALSPVVDLLLEQLVRKRRCCCAGCAALIGELWSSGLLATKSNYTQLAEDVLLVLQERASEPADEDQHLPYVAASTLVSILDYVCRQEDETMAPAVWRSLVYSVIVALGSPQSPDFSSFIASLVAEAISRLPCLPVCMLAEPVCKLVHERDEDTMTESEMALLLAVARHPRLTETVAVEMLSSACHQMVSGAAGIDSIEKRIVKTLAGRYANNKAFADEAPDGCLRQILASLLKGPGSADAVVSIVCIMARAGGRRLGPDEDHLRAATRQLVADLCAAYRSVYAALHPNLLRASRAFPELEEAAVLTTPDPQTDASEGRRPDHLVPVATLLPFGSGPTGMLGTGPLQSFRSRATGRIRELEIQMGMMVEKHKEREDSLESIIRDLESKMGTTGEQGVNRESPTVPKLPLSSRKSSPRKPNDHGSSAVAVSARSPRAPASPPPKDRGKHAGGRRIRKMSGSEGEAKQLVVPPPSSVRQKGVVLVLEGSVADECSRLVKAFAKPLEVIYLQYCNQKTPLGKGAPQRNPTNPNGRRSHRPSLQQDHQTPPIPLLNLLTLLRDAKIIPHVTPRPVAEEFVSSMEHPIRLPQTIEILAQCAFHGMDPAECRPWSQWGVLVPLPEHQQGRQLQCMLQQLMEQATLPKGARGTSDKISISIDEWKAAVRSLVRRYVRSVVDNFSPPTDLGGYDIPPGFTLAPDGKSLYVADKSWGREGRTAKQQARRESEPKPVHTALLYNANTTTSSDASPEESPRQGKTRRQSGSRMPSSQSGGILAAPPLTLPEEAEKTLLLHEAAVKVLGEPWFTKAIQTMHKHFLQVQSGAVSAHAGLRLPAFTKCLTGFLKLLPDVGNAKALFRRVVGPGSQELDVAGLGRAVLASASVMPYGQAAVKGWPTASELLAARPDVLIGVGVRALYQRDFKDISSLKSKLHHFTAGSLPPHTSEHTNRDLAELQGVVIRSGAVLVDGQEAAADEHTGTVEEPSETSAKESDEAPTVVDEKRPETPVKPVDAAEPGSQRQPETDVLPGEQEEEASNVQSPDSLNQEHQQVPKNEEPPSGPEGVVTSPEEVQDEPANPLAAGEDGAGEIPAEAEEGPTEKLEP
ncbi:hypothetical protein FOL47_006682 [Perkinsus chesapeaki]|uniref:Uncharacterized protein n=1 Tax=Perkinsus chesapeaki TaxID=330153 RepID=A0A7J6LQF9_PERCH|nr:hypothetical protein FOL47_006682 [Perkinsus chesapeaki]